LSLSSDSERLTALTSIHDVALNERSEHYDVQCSGSTERNRMDNMTPCPDSFTHIDASQGSSDRAAWRLTRMGSQSTDEPHLGRFQVVRVEGGRDVHEGPLQIYQ
jgi:hypothetical protein